MSRLLCWFLGHCPGSYLPLDPDYEKGITRGWFTWCEDCGKYIEVLNE